MKTTLTSTLAFLLLAGAGTAALAQERDHDRGGGERPQFHPGAPPPAAAPRAAPVAAAAPPAAAPMAPQGGRARFGAPPPPGAAPQVDRGQRFREARPGPGVNPVVTPGADRRHDGERRFDGGGAQRGVVTPGSPPWDRNIGTPREVVTPRAGEHGWDRDRDGRQAANPNWRRDDHRDDHRDGRGDNRWRHGEHWQRGRLPPVFWADQRFRIGPYRAPYGFYVRDWGYGDILPRGWYGDSYYLDDFLDFDLPYPPPGYAWVRVGGDAVMIDRYTGRIVQVVRGIFW